MPEPLDLLANVPALTRHRAEREALNRALAWIKVDPHYDPKTLSSREHDLMMLALRSLTNPPATAAGIAALETKETKTDG